MKNLLKKILPIILALVCSVSLFGCAQTENTQAIREATAVKAAYDSIYYSLSAGNLEIQSFEVEVKSEGDNMYTVTFTVEQIGENYQEQYGSGSFYFKGKYIVPVEIVDTKYNLALAGEWEYEELESYPVEGNN